ncbi:antA/AntB antirepressor family protein [Geobacillus stearothermophilus]
MDKHKYLKIVANEMLPVYENGFGEKFVDARELHEKLMVSTPFHKWIERRISNYGFIEGEDFWTFLSESTGGRPSKEYMFTLDTGKELAMIENNEMGRAIRKYFIEVEKRYRLQRPQSIEDLIILQAQSMKEIRERQERLERENQKLLQEHTVLRHRLDNIDRIDTIGDLRQRLNRMIQRYARQNGIPFNHAWKDFVQAFNTAYKTNLELRRQNYINKTGKDVSRPQFLEDMGLLEDAIRVADKMLNKGVVAQ